MPPVSVAPRHKPVRRRSRSLLAIAAVVAVACAAAAWWASRTPDEQPPAIESLGPMDPDVAALLRELRAAVNASPSDAAAWGRFAMGCEANGITGAARQAYDRAATLAPGDARWWYHLALLRSRSGTIEPALAALTRVNELAPDYAPAWVRRGLWLLDRGDTGGAEAAFAHARAIDRDGIGASIGAARVHLARRDDARAVQVLETLLERHPGDRYALQLLGTAYRRVGRLDDAAFALAVGAAGEPRWPDPWAEEIGDYRRGFAATLKAATAEAMAGRMERALPLVERLRRQRPGDVALANHHAEMLVAAGRPREAIDLLEPMVRAGAARADSHLALAGAYLAARDAARAERHADRALALGAAGARASEIKGLIAWRTGRSSEAIRIFEGGYARDPRNTNLLVWIGAIKLEEKSPREALPLFSDALRRNPMMPDALAGLAMAHAALGAREEAALALARAEQVAPDHPRVREAKRRIMAQ